MNEYFYFDVGHYERHRVEFSFDRFWGKVRILVDGVLIEERTLMFSFSLTERFQFTVGYQERHHVVIDKTRKVMFAGFRPSTYHVYVDGQFAFVHEAA
ncbi:MAG TPA: hypothetical protein VIL71_18445 [Spirillospora sp.]